MSFETAKRAIDFLIEHSGSRRVLETDFFGGEPLMNFDVVKKTVLYGKAEAAKRGKKFLFTLTTNGVLLKGEIADFLNEEFENVVLSLDGRPEVHDAVRKTVNGKGSFDLCFKNIQEFVKQRGDKKYYVRGTYTAKNLDFSKDVLFPVSYTHLGATSPNGRCSCVPAKRRAKVRSWSYPKNFRSPWKG